MENQSTSSRRIVPIMTAVFVLVLAAAAVYSARSSLILRSQLKQAQEEIDQLKTEKRGKPSPPAAPAASEDPERKQLQSRITELQAELKSLQQPTRRPVLSTNAPSPVATNNVSWLERMRLQDPDRYKQMVESREQRRQQAEAFFQEQFKRLDERLQSAPSQEEADLVSQISDTLSKINDLRAEWDRVRQLPDDERRKETQRLGAESWQTYQTYSQLRAKDRQLQLRQLANQIGYSNPQEAEQFTTTVDRVFKETDTSFNRFMGMGRDRGQPQ